MKYYSIICLSLIILCGCAHKSANSDNSSVEGTANIDKVDTSADGRNNSKSQNNIGSWPPSTDMIEADLVGHTLTEGVKDGYRPSDWTCEIEYGDISDLKIIKVLTFTDTKYLAIANMKLSRGGNYYFDTTARINYVRSPGDATPRLDYVTSMGMTIVSDGEYDNDIICDFVDDGWGGVNCLQIKNISEVTLAVGGKCLANNEWHKFSTLVPPQSTKNVGGTFSGGNVTDYKIEFVCREN